MTRRFTTVKRQPFCFIGRCCAWQVEIVQRYLGELNRCVVFSVFCLDLYSFWLLLYELKLELLK